MAATARPIKSRFSVKNSTDVGEVRLYQLNGTSVIRTGFPERIADADRIIRCVTLSAARSDIGDARNDLGGVRARADALAGCDPQVEAAAVLERLIVDVAHVCGR